MYAQAISPASDCILKLNMLAKDEMQLSLYTCRLNWKEAKASSVVASGDLISCRGKGRVEVTAVEMTKKDRYAVHMDRYT